MEARLPSKRPKRIKKVATSWLAMSSRSWGVRPQRPIAQTAFRCARSRATGKACSNEMLPTAASGRPLARVPRQFNFHREWKPVPDNQGPDLARVYIARVFEQVGRFALQIELGTGLHRGRAGNAELKCMHDRGLRIENRLTGPDPQKLDLPEPECSDYFEQAAF